MILNEELRLLKPDTVIFLTSGWENLYIDTLGSNGSNENVQHWDRYFSNYQKYNDTLYIQSTHPQGKPEQEHEEV